MQYHACAACPGHLVPEDAMPTWAGRLIAWLVIGSLVLTMGSLALYADWKFLDPWTSEGTWR